MLNKLLDRPIAVSMSLIVVIILGIASARLLPISLVPDIDAPYVTVQISGSGISARELDESVVQRLRPQLVQVAHLTDFRSETKEGSAVIRLSFEQGSNIDYIFIEVNEKIDRAMSGLPSTIDRPKVIKASATDIPAFYIDLSVKDSERFVQTDPLFPVSERFAELSGFAGQVISKRIEQLPQVAMVDISGTVDMELLIIPDDIKIRQMGIDYSTLEQAIHNANIRLGNLTIRDGEYQYNVRFQSFASSKSDIENIYLNIEGRVYQLRDLARVVEHPRKRNGLIHSNGRDAVTLAVIKQADAKMSALKAGLDELMESFHKDYPNIEFTLTRDQTELLDYSINNLIQNIIVGGILACVIIFFFMQDFKSPVLVVITIPSALILSVLLFHIIGLSINIISLSGLVLGIGMMVDNSIIVIDNITFRWKHGDTLRNAVVQGTQEVFTPMLSSILTTCSVFIPLIFLSGISGALFYDQAMAVTITLFSSFVVTVTLIPVYYWLWYRKAGRIVPSKLLEKISFDRMMNGYERILTWFFRHRGVMWGIFTVSLLGIGVMFSVIAKEKLPAMTYTDMLVDIDWNDRITAEENARRTEAMLAAVGDRVEHSTVMAGVQKFLLAHTDENSIAETVAYIKVREGETVERVQESISNYLSSHYDDIVWSFEPSGNIFDMIFADKDAKLVARLRPTNGEAPDPSSLNRILETINTRMPDVEIQPVVWQEHVLYVAKPEMMALYGISYNQLVSLLKNALNENILFLIVQGQNSLPVIVGSNASGIEQILKDTFVKTGEAEIPVSDFMIQTRDRDLKSIVSGVEGNYYPLNLDLQDRDIPQAIRLIKQAASENDDFEVSFSGTYFSNREMIKELVIVLVISVLLLYFILASQFESLVQPMIILSEIITDLFGALLVLWVFGVSLNLMSLIGIVVMCGIVINDSILKIDTINVLRRQGRSLIHAIVEAGQKRLKPIIMTSLTTILAIAPFLVRGDMGSDLQYPLSMAIIGGMIIGTLVSVFFIPLAYYEIYKPRRRRG